MNKDQSSGNSSDWTKKEHEQLRSSVYKLALLSIIEKRHDEGGIYGYAISKELHSISEGRIDGTNATFYAILRRLEKDELLFSQIVDSSEGPPRKHYYITDLGRASLSSLWTNWKFYYNVLNDLLIK